MTKPEMKRFLQAAYGISVEKIHSLNVAGRRRGEMTTMPRHEKDYKRFYVQLRDEVELPNVPKPLENVKQAPSK